MFTIIISLLVLSENIHWNSVSEWYKLLNIINGHTYLSHIRVYKYLNMIINTILRKKIQEKITSRALVEKQRVNYVKKKENIEDDTTCDDSCAKKAIAARNQDNIA